MKLTPTIGLEIHAELKTKTKMFCNSQNCPDEERPNVHVCPVCMAHPGSLPVVNKNAVLAVRKVGVAVGGELATYTEFDRKNYFYPDIPKGYQISQYEYPLVKGGSLAGVKITRVHLEEDTANSKHKDNHSLLDFNRAGVPLMELVTEPVIHDAATASNFARELQLLLRTLGVGDANMELGQMRVEVNISLSADDTLGTKAEIKNLNSFRSVERAIEYEIKRQTAAIEAGEPLVQETRGFDDATGKTFSQRVKESSHDYRYFPDPDIPKFQLSLKDGFTVEDIRKLLPELPDSKRKRYAEIGLKNDDIETLVSDFVYGDFFDTECAGAGKELSLRAANYLLTDVRGSGADASMLGKISSGVFLKLMQMTLDDRISSRAAKDILAKLLHEGGDPEQIANDGGLLQVVDTKAIEEHVDVVITENPDVFAQYKAGKVEVAQFLIGQVMRRSKGSAKPALVAEILKKRVIL